MRTHLLVLSLVAFIVGTYLSDVAFASSVDYSARVIRDSKTKVVYYLDSDRRHIAAISPDGKLPWCSEVVRIPPKDWKGIKPQSIQAFWLMSPDDKSRGDGNGENYLRVEIIGEGFGGMQGYVDKKSGKFIPGEVS